MLSILSAKEVSDIVNHEVGFLQVTIMSDYTVLHNRGRNEFSFVPTSRIPGRPAPFISSYMVGREDKSERTTEQMFAALKYNTPAGFFGSLDGGTQIFFLILTRQQTKTTYIIYSTTLKLLNNRRVQYRLSGPSEYRAFERCRSPANSRIKIMLAKHSS